MYFVKETRFVL